MHYSFNVQKYNSISLYVYLFLFIIGVKFIQNAKKECLKCELNGENIDWGVTIEMAQ